MTTLVPNLDLFTVTEGYDREVLRDLWVGPVHLDVDSVLYTGLSYKLIQLEFTILEELSFEALSGKLSALNVENVAFPIFSCTSFSSLGFALFWRSAFFPSHSFHDVLLF